MLSFFWTISTGLAYGVEDSCIIIQHLLHNSGDLIMKSKQYTTRWLSNWRIIRCFNDMFQHTYLLLDHYFPMQTCHYIQVHSIPSSPILCADQGPRDLNLGCHYASLLMFYFHLVNLSWRHWIRIHNELAFPINYLTHVTEGNILIYIDEII